MKTTFIKRFASLFLAVVLVLAMFTITCSAANENPISSAREAVVKIIHEIYITVDNVPILVGGWSGSGVLIAQDDSCTSSSLALTAYHVVDDTFYIEDSFIPTDNIYYSYFAKYNGKSIKMIPDVFVKDYILLENDIEVPFEVDSKAYSKESDWALLRLNPDTSKPIQNVRALKLGDSNALQANSKVWALGFPALVETDRQTYTENDVVVTQGIISNPSAKYEGINSMFLMHTAEISGGNSGGPLVDENGNLVGINVIRLHNGVDSYKYASRISDIRNVLDTFNIKYVAASDGFSIPVWAIIAAAGALVVIIGIILIVVLTKKKPAPVAPETPIAPINNAPMIPHIVIQSGRLAGQRYRLEGVVRIGRDATQCNIVYPSNTPGISGLHCEVFVQNGIVYIRDLNSTYGTFLSGNMKLQPGNAVMLTVGSSFYLASPENTIMIQY